MLGESSSENYGLAGSTIPLASELTIDKDLTIDGTSLAPHVLQSA